MPKSRIAPRLGKHRETIYSWIKSVKGAGLLGFLDKYRQAKKGERKKRQVDPLVKRWVWEIREREYDCCGQKTQYFLVKEHGVHLCVPKIYQILAEKYVIRSEWKKNKPRGPIPEAVKPRQVIQMDTIDFGELFAFTAIDTFTMVELFLKRYHYHRPHMGLRVKTPLRKEDECRISTEN